MSVDVSFSENKTRLAELADVLHRISAISHA